MPDVRSRTMQYRRATWFVAPPGKISLEAALRNVDSSLPQVEQTTKLIETDTYCEIRHRKITRNAIYLHAATWIENQSTTTVVHRNTDKPNADLGTLSPPKGEDFTDGEFICRIQGNHVLVSGHHFSEKSFVYYLQELMDQAGLDEDVRSFELQRAAAVDKMEVLQREEVKSITLNASVYEETISQGDDKAKTVRKVMKRKVGKLAKELLYAFLGNDESNAEIKDADNIRATLTISYDGRIKGGELGKARLNKLGETALRDEEEGFSIETRQGNRVTSGELYLNKTVKVGTFANTIRHSELWSEMDKYYAEIAKSLED